MLQQQMEQFITTNVQQNQITLFEIEKQYVQAHDLLSSTVKVLPKVMDIELIEICHKETEEVIPSSSASLENDTIHYVHKHQEAFLYIEASDFEKLGVNGIALERDDVFHTTTALFGLRLQKKYRLELNTYLSSTLQGEGIPYSIQFSDTDGLWDINIALEAIEGFSSSLTIQQTLELLYTFIFSLLEAVESAK